MRISETYWEGANCRNIDPEIMFSEDEKEIALAKLACRECIIQEPCLEFAIKNKQREGIYGGLLPKERQKYARRMQSQS